MLGATLRQLLGSLGTNATEPEPSAHLGSSAGFTAGRGVAEMATTWLGFGFGLGLGLG